MSDEVDQPESNYPAMQTRCPHCNAEQYVLNVIGFSKGEHGCSSCGQLSKPMSYPEWYAALKEWRQKR